ncbi:MAG TPA: tetratricopeptide repeat protein [Burkholderiaceae bacterium]|nr:tetratricopeptide repeat protein [Burkholderiaceae bacterium]
MAYDLQEQEQLDELKAWWGKYGNLILTVATIVLLGFAAYNAWRWYERSQAEEASGVYGEFERAMTARDAERVKALGATLTEKYGRTVYGSMAALQGARWAADNGDLAGARTRLQWLIEHADHPEIVAIARVRLAGVLLDEKQFDEALKVLDSAGSALDATAIADRRGDVLFAQNKIDEARAAYRDALAKAAPEHPLRQIIQLKLDALPATATS